MERAMTAMNRALAGLRLMIASGELGPGEKFPAEPELCERLGVSRSSLREAVRTLGALGVIESRHGLGTYVSSLDPAEIVQSLSLTIDLLPFGGLLQLLEMRRVLEGYAAAQAAARSTTELCDQLHRLVAQMEAETDLDRVATLDNEFHEVFLAAAGNPTIAAFVKVFRSTSSGYNIFSGDNADAARAASDAGHRVIVEAITARDPMAAQAAASAHVAETERWLRKLSPSATQG
jgi:DNA-binding FadR family transcriptional regulator